MKKLLLAAGSRPGILSLAPLYDALKKNGAYQPVALLVSAKGARPLSSDLASCFGIGDDVRTIYLPEGSAVHQLASVMTGMEAILLSEKPDLVLVCGSDNVALGAAVTAAKLGMQAAAVDAGLRSYERSDAEEVNRVVIDAMAEFHFVSEHSGEYNLINEGVADEKVFYSGNLSIDSLVRLMEQANKESTVPVKGIKPKKYALMLIGEGVFSAGKEHIGMLLRVLTELASNITVVMPRIAGFDALLKEHLLDAEFIAIENLKLIEPPSHAGLLTLLRDSMLLLTDTEELQAEATVMNVPCLTMMDTSARPSTIEIGTNVLVGLDEEDIKNRIHDILHPGSHQHITSRSKIPEKWDGASAPRIVAVLDRLL
ncbi:UDP-N-acetyl glucosamine 2-epimerase [Chlorobium sp. KB01]|uniref:UDP-N-acetyl glucosamine 2-epimerase n=1 Tax=Chlorobium sp. KB01 TaxID=1917528 RepID=UPI0009789F1E|nr:UDP-N-acetylglucosamine 2-epimerase [Chlorobium sp. KB01]